MKHQLERNVRIWRQRYPRKVSQRILAKVEEMSIGNVAHIAATMEQRFQAWSRKVEALSGWKPERSDFHPNESLYDRTWADDPNRD